jgi:spore coat polysaccharide biosynthesis protein SpsF
MTSKRLPGKVMLPLAGKPALERMIERVRRAKSVEEVVVATTVNPDDDVIEELANRMGVKVHRGSEDDVLARVLEAAKSVGAELIVELTADCPLMDWRLIDRGVDEFLKSGADYASNTIRRCYPDGFDVQVFPVSVLERVSGLTQDPIDRVHVSLYIYHHPETFKLHHWDPDAADLLWPELRVTLDERADYELLDRVFSALLGTKEDFDAHDVVAYLRAHPEIASLNKYVRTKNWSEG